MKGLKRDRVLVPIRLPKIDYDKCKIKVVEDHLTFQKIMEVLFFGYMKDNKHIREIVMKYASESQDKKRRHQLDDMEINDIRNLIEEEHSPLRLLEKISEEVKKQDEK